MKKLVLALVLSVSFATPAFGALYRIVSSDRGGITIEFTIPEPTIVPVEEGGENRLSRVSLGGFYSLDRDGEPLLPVRRFLFEVPAPSGVALDLLEEDTYFIEGVLPRVTLAKGSLEDELKALAQAPPLGEQRFARLSGVEKIRGRYCAFVDIYPALFDPQGRRLSCARKLLLRLSFPQAEETRASAKRSSFFDDLIVNAAQAASWKHAPERLSPSARTPFEFAQSSNWVKIRVKEKGIYAITYNDLLAAGAYPANIDPATLRLFSAPPYPEPDSLNEGGSFLDSYHYAEHAILYRGTGVGAFQPGDTVLFYGLGIDGWANDASPAAAPRQYLKHPYATENVYWLTWGGSFAGTPLRMRPERSVAPHGSPDTLITWYEARIRSEEDVLYDPVYTDDRWYWSLLKMNGNPSFSHDFYLSDLAGPNGVMKTIAYGPYDSYIYPAVKNSATYLINNLVVGTLQWYTRSGYNPGAMKTLEAPVSNFVGGRNTFTVTKTDSSEMYVLWYEIFYRRLLRASQGAVDFYAPRGALTAGFTLGGFAPGEKLLFDVTFDESPVLCTGWRSESGGLTFEDALGSYAHHYMAVSRSAFKKGILEYGSVPSLRDEGSCPDMVIIYYGRFRDAALMLKAHHDKGLPGIEAPVVRAVDVEDVYNNFSGGRKDPLAIRNYLKFLYDKAGCSSGVEPTLKYVLLIGNGTNDPRDNLEQGNDFVPLYINSRYGDSPEGIEDDDFLVKLDAVADRIPDVAIGRMTVLTSHEADAWAERLVGYEENPEYGTWRDKVILVSDDEYGGGGDTEFYFQNSTEEMTTTLHLFPRAIDFKKIYLHLYPFLGDVKPGARKDFLKEWSDGALIVNFTGHGSPVQMADERVMVDSDIYSLTNGMRRPLVLAFSCSISDLESPYHRSMAQNMVTFDAGGAIGTIAAVAPTIGISNELLCDAIYARLFTSRDSTGTVPVGAALLLAKYLVISRNGSGYESNNSMYVLLGDPAMRLAMPAYKVEHETAPIDTMYTGERYRVDGSIKVGGQVLASFNGVAEVTVEEAEQKVHEVVVRQRATHREAYDLDYVLPGKDIFRGTVDVTAGRFSVEYVVPRRCHTGPNARIRSYVTSSLSDGVGACDTLRIVPADTLRPDREAPSVNLYFAGQATKVKAGAKLMADISDPDGIAILGTDPQSSIYLEFDGSGYPIYVTDYFTYDHGSYTKGKVEYPLSAGFAPGQHTVLIKAFDNLGESSSDTLRFEIVEEGLYEVSDVFNFPNPFSQSTNFVFQVTNPADAKLAVYTVSGLKIWESRLAAQEGFNSINWDGRDVAGDRVANGTYLYVLEVDFRDSFHRKETVKGKVAYLR